MPEFTTTISGRPSLLKSPMATECGRESLIIELRVDDVRKKPHILPKEDKRYEVKLIYLWLFRRDLCYFQLELNKSLKLFSQ